MSRIAVVRRQDCNPEGCGDFLCERKCPVNRKGINCIEKKDKAFIHEDVCIGCDICVKVCPFKAIDIINLPQELGDTPIHRYGRNGFHIYNLPIPIFGKVVGVMGRNGIGKSTAIKILAGALRPNLGKDEEVNYDELIDHFKGTEAQIFFEKVKKEEIVISYKPQQVDLIPKVQEGKVKDLLEKADEKGKLNEIAEQLSLTKILDNDIKNLSGGELQRLAIAAAVLKKANFYVFDEPTSYLDVKQRMRVSKFIRDLADEDTAVMVVEHDLIVLDYMTDLVHLMYGKETAYGIVSQPKSTRKGINIYLEGYLKEENIRFRDRPIKFIEKSGAAKLSGNELTSWKNIKKQLDAFKLEAPEGEFNSQEVVGVMGENGIGKTSFIKILAKVLDPDEGEVDEQIKVAYKPQYLEGDSDDIVMSVLALKVKDVNSTLFKNQIAAPLNLEPLMTKQLNQLSGGELQRVAIAICLGQDAELYLLDEPSAYLDVEQRLLVSKIIRDVMEVSGKTAVVVDHDLLFLDYISNRLLVFDGEPAVEGIAKGPFDMREGMNHFLKDLNMTFRRDPESHRPRANKEDSQKDSEQKSSGDYYYV